MKELTHINEKGSAVMVDISDKDVTPRMARAEGKIKVNPDVLKAIEDDTVPKGDVFAAARIAGIMAAKDTSRLIPLCHNLMLNKVSIELTPDKNDGCILCECCVRLTGKTGAEMEALTGVSVALLTIYDMCKAIDKNMEISDVRLVEKDGGKSGHYERERTNEE